LTTPEAVLRNFTRDGKIVTMPAKRSRRLVLLEHVALRFEVGVRYKESEVNLILRNLHEDYATLRRYLVDEGFLSRDHGEYWRTGGRVDTQVTTSLPIRLPPDLAGRGAAGWRRGRPGRALSPVHPGEVAAGQNLAANLHPAPGPVAAEARHRSESRVRRANLTPRPLVSAGGVLPELGEPGRVDDEK